VKDIGRHKGRVIGLTASAAPDLEYVKHSSSGSMYIFLTIFLIVISLILSLLIFALRLVVLNHDIDHAFERCGVDLLTAVRRENYDAVTESNTDFIDHQINDPLDPSVRENLLESFITNLSNSLQCYIEPGYETIHKKVSTSNASVYLISDFQFSYSNSIEVIRATLEVPIVLFGNTIHVYEKELTYEFTLIAK
jgi:hypothetical protein